MTRRTSFSLFSLQTILMIVPIILIILSTSPDTLCQDSVSDPYSLAEQSLLEGRFDDAISNLKQAAGGPEREKALFRLASILCSEKRLVESLASLDALIGEYPVGPFFHKARFLKAKVLEEKKEFEKAAAIFKEEISRLLSKKRKEEVALFYIKYARALANPDREGGQQLAKAIELYRHALELEVPSTLDEDIRLKIATHLHALKDFRQEERDLLEIKARHPKSNAIDEVDYRLAEAKLKLNRFVEARQAFRKFFMDHPTSTRRPEAHYGIALTYRMPKPNSDQELTLGVKALEDYLACSPKNKNAPKALYEIGAAYYHRGRYDEAVASFENLIKKFCEEPGVEILADARFSLARAFLFQRRYSKSLSALNSFLVEHASHHLWDDAQRLIVDAEFAWCIYQVDEKKYDLAREQLQTFCLKHPLDKRTPDAYLSLGALEKERKNYKAAIFEWEKLVSKYPGTGQASEAQFTIGIILETKLTDLTAALKAYEKVKGGFQNEARRRIAAMKAKSLKVITERGFTSKEKACVKISTRNIESLSFRAYKLDLKDYFMKQHGASRVDDLDIDLIKPDMEWKSQVEGYKKYGEISREEVLPFSEPGAYILNISDNEQTATSLVMITDLQMILKSGREDMLVFVENVAEKKPYAGADIIVSNGEKVLFRGTTGKDGVFLKKDKSLKSAKDIRVLVSSNGHYASNSLILSDLAVADGLTSKAYLFTDRTIYRPGAKVQLKGFIREVDKGAYFFEEGAAYDLHLFSPSGGEILKKSVKANSFGAIDTSVVLSGIAPLGNYRFLVKAASGWSKSLTFPVSKYAKPKAEIVVDLPKDVFHPGEKISGKFKVNYSYGEPVKGKLLRYQYMSGIRIEKETDDNGEVSFQIDSRDFSETGVYAISAEVPSENASANKAFHFSTTAFSLNAEPSRKVLLAGEELTITMKALKPGGDAIGVKTELRIIRLEDVGGVLAEKEIDRIDINIPKSKSGGAAKIALEKGGKYRFRCAAKDRFGNLITADCEAFVSGDSDKVKLRLFSQSVAFDSGETAEIGVHMRCDPNLVLFTCEGEQVFRYRIERLKSGMNKLPVSITENLAPNFTFAAAVMDNRLLHTAQVDFKVRSSLAVTIKPESDVAGPGETIDLFIKVTDRTGKPVEGELAVALVDSALLARFPDKSLPIHDYFFSRERKGRLKTQSSCTFEYKANVKTINKALLAEMGRRAEFAASKDFDELKDVDPGLAQSAIIVEKSAEFKSRRRAKSAKAPGSPVRGSAARKSFGGSAGKKELSKSNLEPMDKAKGLIAMRRPSSDRRARGESAFFFSDGAPVDEDAGLRKKFLETAYWNPSVVTGPDGKATISVSLPDNITSWKILAKGLGKKTSGGQGDAVIKVKKQLFAFLDGPIRLVEGDKAYINARVVNQSDERLSADVKLKITGAANKEYSKTVTVNAGGDAVIDFALPSDKTGVVDLKLTVKANGMSDTTVQRIDVTPYGVPISVGASGGAEASSFAKLALPEDREYAHLSMEVLIGPTFSDYLLHLASHRSNCCPLPTSTDASGRLLIKLYALDYLRKAGRREQINLTRLEERIQDGLTGLLLEQNSSGAYSLIGSKGDSLPATGQALKAMALALKLGFNVPEKTRISCRNWIKNRQRTLDGEEKIYCIHAISYDEKPDFTELNRFFRNRNQLDNNEAAMLALAFINGGYNDQARTLVEILINRNAFTIKAATSEIKKKRISSKAPWAEDQLMTLAHAVNALALTHPGHAKVKAGIDEIMKQISSRWRSSQAIAAAAATLSEYLSKASQVKANYRLELSVNNTVVKTFKINGSSAVKRLDIPREIIRSGDNIVNFSFDGRGAYTYRVRLTGFTRDVKPPRFNAENPLRLTRIYYQAPLMYKGKEAPSGFSSVTLSRGFKTWRHYLKELNEGDVAVVNLHTDHYNSLCRSHAMVITDILPAGCTVIESGIKGAFSHYEIGDGAITFYTNSGYVNLSYPIYGASIGSFKAPPPVLRSLYDFDISTHGAGFDLNINKRNTPRSNDYKMTPDELYYLGIRYFEDENLVGAKELLTEFIEKFTPREKPLIESATKLFKIAYSQEDDDGLIRYFELLRERAPSLTLSFMETARVASAYYSTKENEQALQLMSMIAGASFSRESKVAEALEKQGEFEGAVDYLEKLFLSYPDLPVVQTGLFALSQRVMDKAGAPGSAPLIQGKTRLEIIALALKLLKNFIISYPDNPVGDEASYALISTYLDLEKSSYVSHLCPIFRARWPDSKLKSSMEYAEAFALFETGKYNDAQDLLLAVADRGDRNITPAEKDDRDLARYILAQIEHASGRIETALSRYDQVKKKFEDAKEAISYFTKKEVKLPEISTFKTGDKVSIDLSFCNVADVKLSVYKVDLMKLYLSRKSLNTITNINLAGIKPILSEKVGLGDGKDYKIKKHTLKLPIDDRGAYLLVVQGDEASCSGMALVSDLALEVQEYDISGRVRVNVKNSKTGAFQKNVYLKVIGSRDSLFQSGYTDLRGVFTAENISGTSAVIAEKNGEYAFHRGKLALQEQIRQALRRNMHKDDKPAQKRSRALQNVIESNKAIQKKGQRMLDQIYQQAETQGVLIK